MEDKRIPTNYQYENADSLSKLELAAIHVAAGIASSKSFERWRSNLSTETVRETVAAHAVGIAKAILDECAKS